MAMTDDELMTINEMAEYLNVSRGTVCRLIKNNAITVYRIAGSWRCRESDLKEWLEKQIITVNRPETDGHPME